MDEQIILTFFEDPFLTRVAFDDPFISLAIGFGIGALGTMAALAIAALLQRRER
jgi:hypothetical protein